MYPQQICPVRDVTFFMVKDKGMGKFSQSSMVFMVATTGFSVVLRAVAKSSVSTSLVDGPWQLHYPLRPVSLQLQSRDNDYTAPRKIR